MRLGAAMPGDQKAGRGQPCAKGQKGPWQRHGCAVTCLPDPLPGVRRGRAGGPASPAGPEDGADVLQWLKPCGHKTTTLSESPLLWNANVMPGLTSKGIFLCSGQTLALFEESF